MGGDGAVALRYVAVMVVAATGVVFALAVVTRVWVERTPEQDFVPSLRAVGPLLTALAAGLLFSQHGVTRETVMHGVLLVLVIALALSEVETGLFPNRLTLPGILIGCVAAPWIPERGEFAGVLGAALGMTVVMAMRAALGAQRELIGLGNVKVMGMIGAFLGPGIKTVLLEVVVSLLLIAPLWWLIADRLSLPALTTPDGQVVNGSRRAQIPVGLSYAAAAFVHVVFGRQLALLLAGSGVWPNGFAWH
jgi:prepilin signal peptidase PulO-like enzyme (type II secretory pathway)